MILKNFTNHKTYDIIPLMDYRFFEDSLNVRYSEMDYDLVLKPSALLQFLQDLASDNAEQLNFGYSFIKEKNLAWFLLKYRMEFFDYPQGVYNLKLKTEPRGYNKLFAFRDFELFNGEKLLGRVASTWSLVDVDSRVIVPISQAVENNPYMLPFEKRENDLSYDKVKPFEKIDIQKEFEIRYDDIDVNRHVNNANYIIWAFEPLDFDFRCSKKLKTLDIVFKKEIKFGCKVISQINLCENKTNHILKSAETGEDLCLISASWIDK